MEEWIKNFMEIELFYHPLVLLLIGSGITVGLGQWLSKRYNKKRHETEIKHELIVKITELNSEWAIVTSDMKYPIEDNTDNARVIARIIGELEKKSSVINSLLVLYFSDLSLHKKWSKYSQLHYKFFVYLSTRNENELDELCEDLKIKISSSITGEKLFERIDNGIDELFAELLETIEDSQVTR